MAYKKDWMNIYTWWCEHDGNTRWNKGLTFGPSYQKWCVVLSFLKSLGKTHISTAWYRLKAVFRSDKVIASTWYGYAFFGTTSTDLPWELSQKVTLKHWGLRIGPVVLPNLPEFFPTSFCLKSAGIWDHELIVTKRKKKLTLYTKICNLFLSVFSFNVFMINYLMY